MRRPGPYRSPRRLPGDHEQARWRGAHPRRTTAGRTAGRCAPAGELALASQLFDDDRSGSSARAMAVSNSPRSVRPVPLPVSMPWPIRRENGRGDPRPPTPLRGWTRKAWGGHVPPLPAPGPTAPRGRNAELCHELGGRGPHNMATDQCAVTQVHKLHVPPRSLDERPSVAGHGKHRRGERRCAGRGLRARSDRPTPPRGWSR